MLRETSKNWMGFYKLLHPLKFFPELSVFDLPQNSRILQLFYQLQRQRPRQLRTTTAYLDWQSATLWMAKANSSIVPFNLAAQLFDEQTHRQDRFHIRSFGHHHTSWSHSVGVEHVDHWPGSQALSCIHPRVHPVAEDEEHVWLQSRPILESCQMTLDSV